MSAHLTLSPASFHFDGFRDYNFFDRLRDEKKDEDLKKQKVELGEKQTDAQGAAAFDLDLNQFSDATYEMNLYVEGFEAGGGRSVSTRNSAMISSLPYVIGFKPDGDLSYIQADTPHAIQWIALNPGLEKIAAENLECRLIERTYISVLTKEENGNYAYESVLKEKVIRTEAVTIPAEGLNYALPTDVPGDFVLELHEKSGARVSRASFSVVGRGSVSRSVEKSAELQVKLSAKAYQTGEDIEISIVAPYTGSGLITIERDKVYAHAWFKADRNSTVQHIRVPEGFEGTGYVNVCFVRSLESREIFMSPLSYATAPFQANIEKRRLHVGLRVAEKAKPGEPLRIGYKTDRPARIAVFAVDQGILQVTGYELPDPLGHFFRKEALMVDTAQIVDLILPEYSILRSTAAFGGDGEGKHLNPFKRVTEKPVVFWSGIIDAEPREREVVYDVPDYFSGTLTVMAVAVAPDAVGSAEKNALIRGPFVLTPNVPTVAAPGDEFQVSVTVANGVEGSGAEAKVRLVAEPSEHLGNHQVTGPAVADSGGHGNQRHLHRAGAREIRLGQPRFPLLHRSTPRRQERRDTHSFHAQRAARRSLHDKRARRQFHAGKRGSERRPPASSRFPQAGRDRFRSPAGSGAGPRCLPQKLSQRLFRAAHERRLLPAHARRRSGFRAEPQ